MYRIPDDTYTAIHSIGNGRVCAYANGLDILQLFGPHYSAPDTCTITLKAGADGRESRRLPETAVWSHRLFQNGQETATVTDFAAAGDCAAFIRTVSGTGETTWSIDCKEPKAWHRLSARLLDGAKAYWSQILDGAPFYRYCSTPEGDPGYVTVEPVFACLLFTGEFDVSQTSSRRLEVMGKSGAMLAVFSCTFAGLLDECRRVLEKGADELLADAVADGKRFTAQRRANRPCADAQREQVADDTAMLLRCQQSYTGGILAGHMYHLAYIRDNYGAHRGLLNLGCYEQAKKLLLYYADVFSRYGVLHNAQGTDAHAFHIHENDKVEITGYIVLMAAEYYEETGDVQTLRAMRDVVLWAAQQQHETLRNGMLPFNGDETYIAGGLLPRTVLNDGSMEASALYHRACERLLQYADILEVPKDFQTMLKRDRDEIADRFEENFVKEGRLYANHPRFYPEGEEPLVRPGVYQCGHGMGSCSCRNPDGIYVCPDCADKSIEGLKANRDTWYAIPSAVLMPVVAGSPLMKRPAARQCVEDMLRSFRENGSLTGRKGQMVGYELGELLLALRFLGIGAPEDIDTIVARLLEIRDETGAWVEYYVDGVPTGCRCRPWESGINAAALV